MYVLSHGLRRRRLAGRDTIGARVGVLVHERTVNLTTTARLVLPIAWDLLAVFLECDNLVFLLKVENLQIPFVCGIQ